MATQFQFYDPFVTFTSEGTSFLRTDGMPVLEGWGRRSDSDDAKALFVLGREAYAALAMHLEGKTFTEFYAFHLEGMEFLRGLIENVVELKSIGFKNEYGKPVAPNIANMSHSNLLSVAWQLSMKNASECDFLQGHFLCACLEEIDSALLGCIDDGGGIHSALEAATLFANFQAIQSGSKTLQQARSDLAMRGAMERHRLDPKQDAKRFVKQCWLNWQAAPHSYRSQSVFAADMLTKVPTGDDQQPIISHDTIVKKWIPEWSKQKK